jgi:hypothetical protein
MPKLAHPVDVQTKLLDSSRLSQWLVSADRGKELRQSRDDIEEVLQEIGLDKDEAAQLAAVFNDYREGREPTDFDFEQAMEILATRKKELREALVHQYGEILGTSNPRVQELKEKIRPLFEDAPPRETRLQRVSNMVFTQPGRYIEEIYRSYNEQFPDSISYSTVRTYVIELEEQGEIVTMGGPSGSYRYCFPSPGQADETVPYEDLFGGLRGTIERDLTEQARTTKGFFKDVHLLNTVAEPTLVITRMGKASIEPGSEVKCAGKLHPFSESELDHVGLQLEGAPSDVVRLCEAARIESADERRKTHYSDHPLFQELRESSNRLEV